MTGRSVYQVGDGVGIDAEQASGNTVDFPSVETRDYLPRGRIADRAAQVVFGQPDTGVKKGQVRQYGRLPVR